jgi:hypothetical protein
MIAPAWPGQAWYQAARRDAHQEHFCPTSTPPWASVMFDYSRPPAQQLDAGRRLASASAGQS